MIYWREIINRSTRFGQSEAPVDVALDALAVIDGMFSMAIVAEEIPEQAPGAAVRWRAVGSGDTADLPPEIAVSVTPCATVLRAVMCMEPPQSWPLLPNGGLHQLGRDVMMSSALHAIRATARLWLTLPALVPDDADLLEIARDHARVARDHGHVDRLWHAVQVESDEYERRRSAKQREPSVAVQERKEERRAHILWAIRLRKSRPASRAHVLRWLAESPEGVDGWRGDISADTLGRDMQEAFRLGEVSLDELWPRFKPD